MEEMLRTLSLYDLTGYLIPGIVVVWSLIYVTNGILFRRKRNHIRLGAFAITIAGYITGHLVQAIASSLEQNLLPSSFWLSADKFYPDNAGFSDALGKMILEIFGEVEQKTPFFLCQTYLRVHHLDSYTEIMQARYAFFRGLALALFISGFALAVEALVRAYQARGNAETRHPRMRRNQPHSKRILVLAALLMVATFLSYKRMMKFEHYYVDGVYRLFYVGAQANTKSP